MLYHYTLYGITCIEDVFGQHFRGRTVLIWADCATPGILPKQGKCIRLGTNVILCRYLILLTFVCIAKVLRMGLVKCVDDHTFNM